MLTTKHYKFLKKLPDTPKTFAELNIDYYTFNELFHSSNGQLVSSCVEYTIVKPDKQENTVYITRFGAACLADYEHNSVKMTFDRFVLIATFFTSLIALILPLLNLH